MSQHTFMIQGVLFRVDASDDGLIIYVGDDQAVIGVGDEPSGMACAAVLLEVSEDGSVAVLAWDQQAEAAAANGSYVEPVRIQLTAGELPIHSSAVPLRQPADVR